MQKEDLLAYSVHLLTASGMAAGMYALITIHHGQLQMALWMLGLSVFIDSIDGTLARRWDTKNRAARYDGALMDNIIDYVTWTILPLYWGYVAIGIPAWILLVAATASVLGFSNSEAKTDDHFFKGFPSYWNFVILYCYLLGAGSTVTTILLLVCTLLVFVPLKYVYPSRTKFMQKTTLSLGSVYIIQLIAILYFLKDSPEWVIYSSLIFPLYYVMLSAYLNMRAPAAVGSGGSSH